MSGKAGVASQVISVPKGGGAIHGIGEKFSPDLHTGTGNFTVPITLPPGRNGFQPQLNLSYSTGNGNGPFGLGWNLSIPGVSRLTSKGVPRYRDRGSAEERDIFVLSGAEDLVEITPADLSPQRYRPRTEGLFARIERFQNETSDYWVVASKDGLVSYYGTEKHNIITSGRDPAAITDPDHPKHVFAWKLTRTVDPFGNQIVYTYERDASQADGPHRWDQLYLSEIRYGDYSASDQAHFLVRVKFVYEDRPDKISEYRSGFEMRTVRRCRRIEIYTNADQLQRARTYHLVYRDQLESSSSQLAANGVSLLHQILVEGLDDARPNLLKNPDFEGTEGQTTTFDGKDPGPGGSSAAANWTVWNSVNGITTTELVRSTFPYGGGATMIHVTTTGTGSGLVQTFLDYDTGPSQIIASAWVLVNRGYVAIGTGNGGTTAFDAKSLTTGQWEKLEVKNGVSPANEFIIYSDNETEGGADFYVAMTSVVEGIPGNLLKNPNFKGDKGKTSTLDRKGVNESSAAASWTVWNNVDGITKTEVVSSTFPFGEGATMLHVTTTGIVSGLVQTFIPMINTGPSQIIASAWVFVNRGHVGIGTGNGGSTALDALSSTTGQWEYLEARNGGSPANEFILYSATEGGADFYVAMTSVSEVTRNLLKNSIFDVKEGHQSLPGDSNSAAENWTLWGKKGITTTELVRSTFPYGGGATMIHVTTTGSFNGLMQVFLPPNTGPSQVVASAWIFVKRGRIGIGTGNGGNTAAGDAMSSSTGQWEYLQAKNSISPANEFMIYNATEGEAEFYVAVASVSETPRSEWLPPLEFSYTRFTPGSQKFSTLTGADLPTTSLVNPDLELVDLFGNGLPDVLELGGIARYWRNLGNGKFDRPRTMPTIPAGLRLSDSGVQMLDANGDGRADLLVTTADRAGYYALDFRAQWNRKSWQPYAQAPSFNLEDPEVRLLDLTGDGVSDVLRSGSSFECYFNDAKSGWLPKNTRRIQRQSLDSFPNVSFSDPRVKFADLSGDGLQDIAWVHEGHIDYWPNLGHGRWGSRITMTIPMRLPFQFDPARVILGDVDGDGLADLLYVSDRTVTLWLNRCGNSFSEPVVIHGTPSVTNMDAVRLIDLHGSGVSGVLWSRDADGSGRPNHFFLDLTGGVKPYLLNRMDNNLGAATEVTYASSTQFYLQDQAKPTTQWRSTLPFPVQVVERVKVQDMLSGGVLTTEYRYHHGYWDGAEREFRGFGMVEQLDTEVFDAYTGRDLTSNKNSLQQLLAQQSYAPPLLTRTWFHQGPVEPDDGEYWHDMDYSREYWQSDPSILSVFEETPTALRTLRDAQRALRGSILRTEVYALDGSAWQDRPYTVTEYAYDVREEESQNSALLHRRIFFPYNIAKRTTQWERGNDPQTQFNFTSRYDDVGQPARQLAIACPRGWRTLDDSQFDDRFLATLLHTQYAQGASADRYLRDRTARSRSFELINSSGKSIRELANIHENSNDLRLIAESLNFYDGNDSATAGYGAFDGLPSGQLGKFGALVRTETLIMTPRHLADAFGQKLPPYLNPATSFQPTAEYPAAFVSKLPSLAGYQYRHAADSNSEGYFTVTVSKKYDFHSATGNGRGLVLAQRDPLGHETTITYDSYQVLPIQETGPTGLTTQAEYDMRLFQPKRIIDTNQNVTDIGYTPSGLVSKLWTRGKLGPLLNNDPRNKGDHTVASVSMAYDLNAYYHSRRINPENPQPVFVRTIRRVFHDSDPDDTGETIEVHEYSDGFGRLLQTRTQAEDLLFATHKKNSESGLVGWWKFSEGSGGIIADSSGQGRQGTLAGAVSFTKDPTFGTVLDFTGLDGRMDIPHHPSLEPATGTIGVWIKIPALQNSDIIRKTTTRLVRTEHPSDPSVGVERSVIALRIFDYGAFHAAIANDDPTTPGQPWRFAVSPPGLITPGKWHHLAMRWDGNTIAVFLNGKLQASTPYDPVPDTGLSYYNGSALSLGAGTNWGTSSPGPHEFIGQLADVRYYNRACSNAEILADFVESSHRDILFGNAVLPPMQPDKGGDITGYKFPGLQRVIVSGWQKYDNKGRVVEKYEPFYDSGWDYQRVQDHQLGQHVTMYYDPRGQVIRTVNPDGSEQRVIHGIPVNLDDPPLSLLETGKFTPTPWEAYTYDANDNAGRTHGNEEQHPMYRHHWNTPASIEIDALGRTIRTVARHRNGPLTDGTLPPVEEHVTRSEYDLQGNLLRLRDSLGRLAFEYGYDLAKHALRTESIDAGHKTTVLDAAGNLVEQRDAKGALKLHTYDALNRPLQLWARDRGSSTSLAAHWKFDEGSGTTLADVSGKEHHGALNGGATWVPGITGNWALHFDGIDDYVQAANPTALVMNESVTMSAWINPSGLGSSPDGFRMIVNKEYQYEMSCFSDNTIRWAFANTYPGWTSINTNFIVHENQWTHVAVTYHKGLVKTYANGQLVHTYHGTGNIDWYVDAPARIHDFRIGGRQSLPDFFHGAIDDVRIYASALDESALAALAKPPYEDAQTDTLVTLREDIMYGDDEARSGLSRHEASVRNLLGKPYQHKDEAGWVTFEDYDFKGNPLASVRQTLSDDFMLRNFRAQHDPDWVLQAPRVDWSAPPANMLDTNLYHTRSAFDALNRIKWSEYPEAANGERYRLRPSYNRAGALDRVDLEGPLASDGNGASQSFVKQIAYNAKGQRTLIAYGNGIMTRYAYDDQTFRLVRLRTERYTQNDPNSHDYQLSGAPLQDIAYRYDLAGNILSTLDQTPGCGIAGNPEAINNSGALRELLSKGDALLRQFSYDPLYRLVSATGRECKNIPAPRPWSDVARCGFNNGRHGTSDQDNAPNLTALYREEYDYDATGNMLTLRHQQNGNTNVAWSRRFGMDGYTPDEWQQQATTHLTGDWDSPSSNRLTHVQDGSSPASASVPQSHFYDANGNMLREHTERHFEWDHADRLKAFRNQTGTSRPTTYALYLYDSAGQRVKKLVVNGNSYRTTTYLGAVFEHHTQQNLNDTQKEENCTLHVMDNQSRIAIVRVGPAFEGDGAAEHPVQYYLGDHLGSSAVVISGAGDWINREEFFPYGETSSGSFGRKRYRFTGKERDEESGLNYHGARYYAGWLGRWVVCDPVGSIDGLNLLCYVKNNPIFFRDLTGKQGESDFSSLNPIVTNTSQSEKLAEILDKPPKPIPENVTGTNYESAAKAGRNAFRSENPMPEGAHAQHWTKQITSENTNMPSEVMNQNMSPLQSSNSRQATTLLKDPAGGGTKYSVEGETTYGNEHKFADRHLIRAEEAKSLSSANPRNAAAEAGQAGRWRMTGEPGPGPGRNLPLPRGGAGGFVTIEGALGIAGVSIALLDITSKTIATTEEKGTSAGFSQAAKTTAQHVNGALWFALGASIGATILTGGLASPLAATAVAMFVATGGSYVTNSIIDDLTPGLR